MQGLLSVTRAWVFDTLRFKVPCQSILCLVFLTASAFPFLFLLSISDKNTVSRLRRFVFFVSNERVDTYSDVEGQQSSLQMSLKTAIPTSYCSDAGKLPGSHEEKNPQDNVAFVLGLLVISKHLGTPL